MLSLRIDQNDASLTVGDHDAVGSGFEQGAEVCFAARPRRGGSLLHAGRQSESPVGSCETAHARLATERRRQIPISSPATPGTPPPDALPHFPPPRNPAPTRTGVRWGKRVSV